MKKDKLKKCHAITLAATLIMSTVAMIQPASASIPIPSVTVLRTVYVDSTNGKNTNNGSSKKMAYKTIKKAAESVADGGTIVIVGTYSCKDVTDRFWGAPGKQITIRGNDGDSTLDISQADKVNIIGPTNLYNLTFKANDKGGIYANGNEFVVGSSVTFEGVQNDIYGGTDKGSDQEEVTSTSLKLYAGNYYHIYGGSYEKAVNGDTHVYIGDNVNQVIYNNKPWYYTMSSYLHHLMDAEADANYHNVTRRYDVYGGSRGAAVKGNTYVEIDGTNTYISSIFGGCQWEWYKNAVMPTVSGTSSVCLKNGTVYSIFGGSKKTGFKDTVKTTQTKVTVTGGTVAQVFGGSLSGSLSGSTQVMITGGILARRAYGGCYNDLDNKEDGYYVKGNTFLAIDHNVDCRFNDDDYNDRIHEDNVLSACSRSQKSVSDERSKMWISPTLYKNWYNHEVLRNGSRLDSCLWMFENVQLMLRDEPRYNKKNTNIKGKPFYLIDLNGDKKTDEKDVEALSKYIKDNKPYKDDVDVNGDGKIDATDADQLREWVHVDITEQPTSVTKALNEKATFTVAASGTVLSYQWQYNKGNGWANYTSLDSKTASITVTASSGENGYKYRCVVRSLNGTSFTSNAATLTIMAKIVYKANMGSRFNDVVQEHISGKAVNLKSANTFTWHGYVFNGWNTHVDGSGNTYAANQEVAWKDNVTLYAQWKPISSMITVQPKSVRTIVNTTAEFTVKTTGTVRSYQWQYNDGNGWKDCSASTTAATINVLATTAKNGYQYRCIVTFSNGIREVSDSAVLTVISENYM